MTPRTPELTSETRITRRAHVTDPAAALDEALRENDALAAAIAELQRNALTSEEHAYIVNKKEADERASWAWKMLRTYAPWATAVCSAAGALAYWLVSNFQMRPHQ